MTKMRNKHFLEEHDCHVCINCGGDLPEQWVKGMCESCAQQLNDDFEKVKRTPEEQALAERAEKK